MSPLISAGLVTAALAGKITARYRVHTGGASAAQDGSPQPATSVQRTLPPSGDPAQGTQSRGTTLDLSV